ncbi:MAG TPA: efflux RND transporter periplasmic adaptor subunit [Xanthobacteraceae bacterium]|nr:efflux RND transporter periplasmic adaptor subunit [Xanthobacteraceae bacterium]
MSFGSDASPSGVGGNVVKFPGSVSGGRSVWQRVRQRSVSGLTVHGFTVSVVLLATAGVGIGLWSFNAASPPRYVTVPAGRGPVTRAVTAIGTINPAQTVVVSAAVSGIVQHIACDYDGKVKAGQVCATIDRRSYQAALDQYSGQLLRDQAILEKDRADLARLHRHIADIPFARQQIAAQSLVISRDEGTVKIDQALVDGAKLNLSYTDIVAPADGVVVARNVSEGQAVAANAAALFVIAADPRHVEVDADPGHGDVGAIQRGDPATMTVEGLPHRVFHGTVSQVRRSVQSGQATTGYDAVVAVENPDLALKPGMTASTQIVVDQRDNVLRVPDRALQFAPTVAKAQASVPPETDQPQIWVLRGSTPVGVYVVTGLDDGKFTEIAQGELHPGDQVIVGENRPQAQVAPSGAP